MPRRDFGMSEQEAAELKRGDPVDYFDGQVWRLATVLRPLADVRSHKGKTVRVDTGTYSTEAAAREIRP